MQRTTRSVERGSRKGYRDEEAGRGRCRMDRVIEAIIAGLLMSDLVDIVGFPLFHRVVEIWLLPVVLGIGGAARGLDAWT